MKERAAVTHKNCSQIQSAVIYLIVKNIVSEQAKRVILFHL